MNKINMILDKDSDMLKIEINDECVFSGNVWEFKRIKDLENIFTSLKNVDFQYIEQEIEI